MEKNKVLLWQARREPLIQRMFSCKEKKIYVIPFYCVIPQKKKMIIGTWTFITYSHDRLPFFKCQHSNYKGASWSEGFAGKPSAKLFGKHEL